MIEVVDDVNSNPTHMPESSPMGFRGSCIDRPCCERTHVFANNFFAQLFVAGSIITITAFIITASSAFVPILAVGMIATAFFCVNYQT